MNPPFATTTPRPTASTARAATAPVAPTTNTVLVKRWPVIQPFLAVGAICIIAGGVVAAVARPTGFEMGSWLAAFLVLVGGVAQVALGVGQGWLAVIAPAPRTIYGELVVFNVGAALTVIGSLAAIPAVTTVGSLCVVAALVLFLRGVGGGTYRLRRPLLAYQLLVWFVLLSTPVGIVLAWIRHG